MFLQVLGRDMGISLDMGGWMLAGALALVLGGGCLWFRHEAQEAQKSAALWESSARGAQAALQEMESARRAAENALAERRATVERLEREQAGLRAKIREAKRYYETVRLWYGTPLPLPLRGLLTEGGSSGSAAAENGSSGAFAGSDAGADLSGDEQRGSAGMGPGEPGRAASLQRGQTGD